MLDGRFHRDCLSATRTRLSILTSPSIPSAAIHPFLFFLDVSAPLTMRHDATSEYLHGRE